jgi:hypothetical protein
MYVTYVLGIMCNPCGRKVSKSPLADGLFAFCGEGEG